MRQRLRLGALHVGFVAGQPEQAGSGAGTGANRNAAVFAARANFQEFQSVIVQDTALAGSKFELR
jgi:hypothetical protein